MNIHNQKKFFQNIFLDSNGNMVLVVEPKQVPLEKGVSQKNTFQKLTLTPEGYLKIYEA
tara:strand:+ start:41 stop:217 length:177 start_codon:yes stop_codon:yes gene_type:complete